MVLASFRSQSKIFIFILLMKWYPQFPCFTRISWIILSMNHTRQIETVFLENSNNSLLSYIQIDGKLTNKYCECIVRLQLTLTRDTFIKIFLTIESTLYLEFCEIAEIHIIIIYWMIFLFKYFKPEFFLYSRQIIL